MAVAFSAMGKPQAELLGRLEAGGELVRFVCELEPCAEADAAKPRWIHMMPLGPEVEARDGRKFTIANAENVVAASELPMLVDWEHASEHGDTRAAGWVEELKLEPETAGSRAGVWGRVNWTPQGREHVNTQHYRFLSPVLIGKRMASEAGKKFHVEQIASVALTNRPALRMHGIETFRAEFSTRFGPFATTETETMDATTRKALCTAFGIPESSDDAALLGAATPLIEAARKGVVGDSTRTALAQLTQDLNAANLKTVALETELATHRKVTFATEVQAFFDKGSRERRIPPAARAKWLESCSADEAFFETFKTVIYPNLVAIGEGAPPPPKKPKAMLFSERSENGVDRAALRAHGLTEQQILESEAEVFAKRSTRIGPGDEAEDADDEDEGDDAGGDETGGEEATAS